MKDWIEAGKMSIIMDGQFGSTGKGLISSIIATDETDANWSVTNNASNAGHTFDLNDGLGKRTVYHLPVYGVINKTANIYLCAGAMVDIDTLRKEMLDFGVTKDRVFIHPNATIIEKCDKEGEANGSGASKIASTQKGCGHALARKLNRAGNVAKNFVSELPATVSDINLMRVMDKGESVVMEIPQGFGLSLNSMFHPHCTSRDITVMQALNDARVHPSYLGPVVMSLRTYPIRVGNLVDKSTGEQVGYSGDVYPDQKEVSWEELDLPAELTTVTKRVRRVFTWSNTLFYDACDVNRPTHVFLNFCNYLKSYDELWRILSVIGTRVPVYNIVLGFGHSVSDWHTVGELVEMSPDELAELPWGQSDGAADPE